MTSDGRAGAVAQVPGLRNPIRLARYLLEQDAHVMLCGPEALQLALRLGHSQGVVATPGKIRYWAERLGEAYSKLDYAAMAEDWKRDNPRLGTVGCVALDAGGRLAAATSTGGTGQCYPGRIGDTPVIGAGTYCTARAGVSMTGVGERILVLLSAKRACDLVHGGRPLPEAARDAIAEIRAANSWAGIIALDAEGGMTDFRNTPFMPVARRS
jgi:beta-aspartyl-peptidase (threonine type)